MFYVGLMFTSRESTAFNSLGVYRLSEILHTEHTRLDIFSYEFDILGVEYLSRLSIISTKKVSPVDQLEALFTEPRQNNIFNVCYKLCLLVISFNTYISALFLMQLPP